MNHDFIQRRSLRAKITLFTLIVLVVSIWSLTYYASRIMRKNLQDLQSAQQYSVVSIIASEIDHELRDRLVALQEVAKSIQPELLENATALQAYLNQRPVFNENFNGGTFVTKIDGVATASAPYSVERVGISYLDRDYIAAALGQGKSYIGRPVMGRRLSVTVVGMAAPIRDAQGKVIGAVAGIIDLTQPSFLDRLAGKQFGKTGGYVVVAPQYRTIVTATDKRRIMASLPAAGVNQMIDHHIAGDEGSDVLLNADGVEVLTSVQSIPTAGWFVALSLPTAEAFAPIQKVRERILLAAILMTLAAAGLTWWLMRHYLAPLTASARMLAANSGKGIPDQFLAVTRQDEIGQLLGGFNQLLENLKQRENLLRHIFDTSNAAIFVCDGRGIITQANQRMAYMSGCKLDDLHGMDYISLVHPSERESARKNMHALLNDAIDSVNLERLYLRTDQSRYWGHLNCKRFTPIGGKESGLIGEITDITEGKHIGQFEKFRSHVLELLVSNASLISILQTLAAEVEKFDPDMVCKVFLVNPQNQRLDLVAAPSLTDVFSPAIDGLAIGPGSGSSGTAAFTGERVIVEDIGSHPDWVAYKDLAAIAGLAACWAQPIKSSSGVVLGTIDICNRTVHAPGQAEIFLIEQTARLASIAIERSLANEAISDSEERFRSLMVNIPSVAVQGYAMDGTVQFWNRASEQLYGYSATEAMGSNLLDLIIPQAMKQGVMDAIQQMSETGDPIPASELTLTKKDGSLVPVFSSHALVQKVSGEAEFFCLDIDLTQRKQIEGSLEENQEKYRGLSEAAFEAVFISENGICLEQNTRAREMFGYTAEEAVGKSGTDWVIPQDRNRVRENMTIGLSLPYEAAALRKDGTTFPAIFRARMMRYKGREVRVTSVEDITQRKQDEEQIQRLAFYDVLTSLPNRRLLLDRIQQALTSSVRHQHHGSLLFVDMDDFKTLNDTLGHASGDLLLKQVARRLTGCIRESDTVARLGGDEFVVMLENLSDNERLACGQAETVAKKVLASIGKSYSLDGHEHHCTASIGVTLFGAENEDIEEPLKRADLAMYQAKTAGRNTLRFFDPEMQSRLMARAAMEADLRAGLQNQHFILYFQPQITNQHHISGAEALLRWSHPVRGMELPANFIALAEETGLILPLGQWVLQSACDQLAQWAGQAALAHLKIAVNVSARQFHQNDFVDQVLEIVKRTGAKPELLRLELTESVLISNVEAVIAKMNALKAFGIGFAIDDFGTGYSSLSYLKRLPLDELKIDQGFVKDILIDPDDAAIARMVIALGRSLELDILAEGVETEQQRAFLAELGCHNYQGYLFSRPVPAQEFEALVMQI